MLIYQKIRVADSVRSLGLRSEKEEENLFGSAYDTEFFTKRRCSAFRFAQVSCSSYYGFVELV